MPVFRRKAGSVFLRFSRCISQASRLAQWSLSVRPLCEYCRSQEYKSPQKGCSAHNFVSCWAQSNAVHANAMLHVYVCLYSVCLSGLLGLLRSVLRSRCDSVSDTTLRIVSIYTPSTSMENIPNPKLLVPNGTLHLDNPALVRLAP
jgi:hypothetical protein